MKKGLKNVVVALSVVFTCSYIVAPAIPYFNVQATNTYVLTSSVTRYNNADNAKNRVNGLGTYTQGTYYIYKTYNGMINISKVEGAAGSWINPGDNKAPINTVPTETKATTPATTTPKTTTATNVTKATTTTNANQVIVVGGNYTLYKNISKFTTADNALNNVNSYGTYTVGNYFIYKIYNGMINISKVKGTPGAWINPNLNGSPATTTPVTKPSTTTPATTTPVTKPSTTTPATKPSITTPSTTTPITKATTPTTTTAKPEINVGGKYVVTSTIPVYSNASDAKNMTNSVSSYSAGTYFVYKIYDGMVNISKTPGVPGAWVNVGSISTNTTPTNTNSTTPGTSVTQYKKPNKTGYINYSTIPNLYVVTNLAKGETATLRSTPGGSIIKKAFYGTLLEKLETSGNYTKVKEMGTNNVGWIANANIALLPKLTDKVLPKAGGNGIVIGIDPGHESTDTGAVGYVNGRAYTERTVNWQIANVTKDVLEKMGFTVVLSRKAELDENWLYKVGNLFNQAEVDYAISIHNNGDNYGSTGSMNLYAANKVNPTAQSINIELGRQLGNNIGNELYKVSGSIQNISDRAFYGVNENLKFNLATDAPSTLLELNYMTNSNSLSQLLSPSGQLRYANAIANGIIKTLKGNR